MTSSFRKEFLPVVFNLCDCFTKVEEDEEEEEDDDGDYGSPFPEEDDDDGDCGSPFPPFPFFD